MQNAQNYYPDCPEALIISLASDGDKQAFEELLKRRQSPIRNLMRRCCHDPVLADDLAQQVFLKVWTNLGSLKEIDAFGAWLKKVAISIWLQHLRKKDALNNSDELQDFDLATSVTSGLTLDLDDALAQLPERVKLCIILNYSEGMTHQEISDCTLIPLGTVKSNIVRGSKRLRILLGDYENGNN